MKLRINLILRKALLAAMAALASSHVSQAEQTYMVDGVNAQNVLKSDLFYDSGKGVWWYYPESKLYQATEQLYRQNGNNTSFLGELESYVLQTKTFSPETMSALTMDGSDQDLHVASNVLQYWQNFYGVFYTGERELPHGLNYDKEYLSALAGAHSTQTGSYLYDSFYPAYTPMVTERISWYISGYSWSGVVVPGREGAFFADYFEYDDYFSSTGANNYIKTNRQLLSVVCDVLGFKIKKDGSYTTENPGSLGMLQIEAEDPMYVGTPWEGEKLWYTLTCYGITLNDDGSLKSLKVANSDDETYALFDLYVREENGSLFFYSDAQAWQEWDYSDLDWRYESFYVFATSEKLLDMYGEYHAKDNLLVWSGNSSEWKTVAPVSRDILPTATEGWAKRADGALYNAHADFAAGVVFDDSAENKNVHVVGEVCTEQMHLNHHSYYFFDGASDALVRTESLQGHGWGKTVLADCTGMGGQLLLNRHSLELSAGAEWRFERASLTNHATLRLNGGCLDLTQLSADSYCTLEVGDYSSLNALALETQGSLTLRYTAAGALLDFNGQISTDRPINIEYSADAVAGQPYALIHFAQDCRDWSQQFSTNDGMLFYDNEERILFLIYNPATSLSWGAGEGTWSYGNWKGTALDTSDKILLLNDAAGGTIEVGGAVSAYRIDVDAGHYELVGSQGSYIDGLVHIAVSGNAQLTTGVEMTEAVVELRDRSTLKITNASAGSIYFADLDAIEDSRLVIGEDAWLKVNNVSALQNLEVEQGGYVELVASSDLSMNGNIVLSDLATLALKADPDANVTYALDGELSISNLATVSIGKNVSLRVSGTLPEFAYTMTDGAVLELTGMGEFTSQIYGKGTLKVLKDASIDFAYDEEYYPTFSVNQFSYIVDGVATIHTTRSGKGAILTLPSVEASGNFIISCGPSKHVVNSVSLNGGQFAFRESAILAEDYLFDRRINQLHVGENGGLLLSIPNSCRVGSDFVYEIGELSGTGDFEVIGLYREATTHLFKLESIAADDFSGRLGIYHNTIVQSQTNRQGTVLEMDSLSMSGYVELGSAIKDSEQHFMALGIKGDVQIGGLESSEDLTTDAIVYSGHLDVEKIPLRLGMDFLDAVQPEEHTLTLDCKYWYNFHGSIVGGVNLVKKGTGVQVLGGDMSRFNGSLDVLGGSLIIHEDISTTRASVEDALLQVNGRFSVDSSFTLNNAQIGMGSLYCPDSAFFGCSTINIGYINTRRWQFNVSLCNIETPVLTLQGNNADFADLPEFSVAYDADNLYSGDYKILQFESGLIDEALILSQLPGAYIVTEMVEGKQMSTLVYQIKSYGLLPVRSETANLSWQAASGKWDVAHGHKELVWSSNSDNNNFYQGDNVFFSSKARVELVGNLEPNAVHVNTDSSIEFYGSGSIAGNAGLYKSGSGSLIIATENSYAGGTELNGGSIYVTTTGALGSDAVVMRRGALNLGNERFLNDIIAHGGLLEEAAGYEGYLKVVGNLEIKGDFTCFDRIELGRTASLSADSTLTIGKNQELVVQGGTLATDVVFEGGSLTIGNTPLFVEGSLILRPFEIVLTGDYEIGKSYVLVKSEGEIIGSPVLLSGYWENHDNRYHCVFNKEYNQLLVHIERIVSNFTWANASGAVWQVGQMGWKEPGVFKVGDNVTFADGTVTIVGDVTPGMVLLNPDKSLAFKTKYDQSNGVYSGAIVGDTAVTIAGSVKSKITMNDGNTYSGGTIVENGTLKAGGASSFGTGDITLLGGTLDLAGKAVANDIELNGAVVIKGGAKYTGEFTMTGGVLQKGSVINVADSATLAGGTMDGTLSGTGMVQVTGAVTLGDAAKVTTTQGLTVAESGALTVGAKGLALNAKTSTLTIDGGSLASAGKLSGYALSMSDGATLTVSNAKPMAVNFKGGVSASGIIDKSGMVTKFAEIGIYGAFTATELDLTGSKFTLEMNPDLVDAKNQPKAQSITINGKGTDSCLDTSEMVIAGKMSITGDLTLQNSSSLTLYDPSGKNAAMPLAVKGSLTMSVDSELSLNGKLSAASLSMTDSNITLSNEKAQSIALTMAKDAQKRAVNNTLNNSRITANASMSVAGNLELSGASSIHLWDANTAKPKALNLAVKGNLTVGSGSRLTLSGALSAANLTLDGGSINLTGTKPQTIKVGNELTLNGGTELNLGFTVTQADVDKSKVFKLFTFKVFDTEVTDTDLYSLLGLSQELCTLNFDKSRKAITLVVNDMEEWNKQAATVQNAQPTEASTATEAAAEEVEDMLFAPAPVAAEMAPELQKVADTLVQCTWGTVGASRAFTDTIANRGAYSTLFAGGRGAAWVSTMGGSSRISSDGGHAGADYTLTGAAFGIEARVTEDSTIGLAIGNSWGKVNTLGAYAVDGDYTHQGIYGNHKLNDALTLSWAATHTRTEADATILGMPCDWSQDALQLDARLTWTQALNERTAVSVFGGMQYLATDKGECNGLSTGSLQNLRAEIGVGASHKFSSNTMVYGELSFVGDMVRNNPTATVGDARAHGANPGRAGLNLSTGATHRLNDDWSVNGSYNFEWMQNVTSHGLNIGATYSF